MNSELILALNALEAEKHINKELMFEALETALITAYKKNFGSGYNCFAAVNRETGDMRVYCAKEVTEEVTDPCTQMTLEEAKTINRRYGIGDIVELDADPAKFGRIAAQTAKQIVVQKIREAERGNMYSEYSDKENDVMTGKVEKLDRRGVLIDLGTAEALLATSEQIPGESYTPGKRIKVYVFEVKKTTKNVSLMVSRTHPGLVKKLFEKEIPEIADGTVIIKSIAREAGSRTKLAVFSENPDIDPVGSCVGQKGVRVAGIVEELNDEKIDVIQYSEDPAQYISAALNPAKVLSVEIDEENKSAVVTVPEFQLSLAIGKEGQNARLAARLTGWKIDIKSDEAADGKEE